MIKHRSKSLNFRWTVIAGPCSAESEKQIINTAVFLKKHGVSVLRAGIWKPRTKSDDWQGAGDQAIDWLCKAKQKTGITIATEVKDKRTLDISIGAGMDIIWIGSRNGQNYAFLEEVGKKTSKTHTPVILKRSMSASLTEWIGAAGYIIKHNRNVILCERGIRGYSPDTRNILDLQTAYLAKIKAKLPVIIDVSHAAGRTDLIIPMSLAAKAAGFDGLMVEMHPDPKSAMTDSFQQINKLHFKKLVKLLNKIRT